MDLNTNTFEAILPDTSQDCMFKSLLTQIQMQITSIDQKPLCLFNSLPELNSQNYYCHQKQMQCQTPNKSISEWVWKDDDENQFEEIPSREEIIPETFQLKRVQSMRMQQENKLSQFLRTNNLINQQQDDQYLNDLKETMNLSPRKKKRIDKTDKNYQDRHKQRQRASPTMEQNWSGKKVQMIWIQKHFNFLQTKH